mgnify:CR=1 FL=1
MGGVEDLKVSDFEEEYEESPNYLSSNANEIHKSNREENTASINVNVKIK